MLADGEPVFENTAVKARMAYIPDEVFYFPQANVNDMMRFYKSVLPSFDAERFERLAEAFPHRPQDADKALFARHEEAGRLLAGPLHAA